MPQMHLGWRRTWVEERDVGQPPCSLALVCSTACGTHTQQPGVSSVRTAKDLVKPRTPGRAHSYVTAAHSQCETVQQPRLVGHKHKILSVARTAAPEGSPGDVVPHKRAVGEQPRQVHHDFPRPAAHAAVQPRPGSAQHMTPAAQLAGLVSGCPVPSSLCAALSRPRSYSNKQCHARQHTACVLHQGR